MNYNKTIENVGARKKERVRDELTGQCLELDCDMHVAKDLGLHCKRLNKQFNANLFISLWHAWWKALAPQALLNARDDLVNFIDSQDRKDVQADLRGLYNFYSREGERFLHLFRDPQANLAEALNNKDNVALGTYKSVSESLRLEIISFLTQATKLKYLGEGGHEGRQPRVDSLYQERRANYAAAERANAYSGDIMDQVRAVWVHSEAVTQENRSHRADRPATFPRQPRAAPEEVLNEFCAFHPMNIFYSSLLFPLTIRCCRRRLCL